MVAVAVVAWPAAPAQAVIRIPFPPVVFVAVPDLRWSDVAHMPMLTALADHSAVANLSVRSKARDAMW